MGCRFTTLNDKEAVRRCQTPTHLTARPSSYGEAEPEAEAETSPTKVSASQSREIPELVDTSSSLSVPPRTVTSQLSDIVDLCEEMEEQNVKKKSEAVLERILRAQFRLEQQGDAAPLKTARSVSEIDARFQEFLAEYAGVQDATRILDAQAVLEKIDSELDAANAQLYPSSG
ncbi:unnamed protein product [Phytophthora lilii]|uniref:Unnamed protein product n=1 Tax=Phytophthora lilii TaxID=2077276 RepID=A0A9W6TSZ9_9STRA|nr:unnamed protein product [Phytophthora lilii]